VADCLAVLDAAAARRVVVLGHEHGGPVALRVAAERPNVVIGLVLHSTSAHPLRAADHPYGPSGTPQRIDAMIDRRPGSADMLRVVAPSAGYDPQLRGWLDRAGRLGAGPARAKELHRTYLEADVRDILPRIEAPTIVLHPARTVVTDPGQARYLADHIPHTELLMLDSADHLFWASEPDGAAMLSALERLAQQPTVSRPPARIRAIVAVAPSSTQATRLLGANKAESVMTVGEATAATFDSIAAAQAAITTLRQTQPAAYAILQIADTTSVPTDPAIIEAAQKVQSRASTVQ
jgi:hypothetical protein